MTDFNGGNGFGGGSLPPTTIYGDLTVTGRILASDGALGAPSYTFANDTTEGIYRSVNAGTGHGVVISGGTGGGMLTVEKDSKTVDIIGSLTVSSTTALSTLSAQTITATTVTISTLTAGTLTTTGIGTLNSIVTPLQPLYQRTATAQTISNGSNQFVNFDTLVRDINTGNFSWTSGLGTYEAFVNTAGYYSSDAMISWTASGPGYRSIMLYENGTVVAQQQITCSGGEAINLSVHYEDYLAINTLIYVQVFSSGGGTNTVSGALSIKKTG
jgi:hypothetical protein